MHRGQHSQLIYPRSTIFTLAGIFKGQPPQVVSFLQAMQPLPNSSVVQPEPDSSQDWEPWGEEEEAEELETVLRVVPELYHDHTDVFSKVKAEHLPQHRACDNHIELVGEIPPPGVYFEGHSERYGRRRY